MKPIAQLPNQAYRTGNKIQPRNSEMKFGLIAIVCAATALVTSAHAATIKPVDGDTFWYNSTQLRLSAVDTPEPTKYGNAECPYEAKLDDMLIDAGLAMPWMGRQVDWCGGK